MVSSPRNFPMATPRAAAGALFLDHEGRILMVRPTYKEGWDIPGGYIEPGETPMDACAREITEEIGLHRAPGRLLVVDWAPHPDEGDKILFVFDGGTLTGTGSLTPDGEEIAEAQFCHSDTLPEITPERLTRRLKLAIEARERNITLYAQHGTPTP